MHHSTFLSTQSFAQYDESTIRQQCRICLQQIQQRLSPYCQCRGNHRSVHQKCLKQWARRADKYRDGQGNVYFMCDLCKTPIYLLIGKECHFRTRGEIWKLFREDCCRVMVLVLIFLLFVGVLGICIFSLLKNQENQGIYITLAAVAGLIAAFAFVLILIRVVLKFNEKINGLLQSNKVNRSSIIANSHIQSQI